MCGGGNAYREDHNIMALLRGYNGFCGFHDCPFER